MTDETIEQRTNRVIAGVRRSNFKHSGNFRVYSITRNNSLENGYNKTLVIGNVDLKYAEDFVEKEKHNKSYGRLGIEEKKDV